ncbi:hypothetical protein [Streptomyces rhizosphaerihabitans]|uniref:hypothetical protein n=1 Tax=Streptomyces rhizosphaerihabitans TaxID=1266770 RepID=UPI0021BFDD01|nr:hypothetical protein [Streptomyces rhizosphaerihabitans]MCT9007382.1 hypothetical protein [Streptomyces rhizosphaerihabitans]
MAAVFIVVITTLIVLATTAVLVGRGPVRYSGGPSLRFGPSYDPALTHDEDPGVADPRPGRH